MARRVLGGLPLLSGRTPARRAAAFRFDLSLGAIGGTWVALAFVFARVGIPAWIPPAPLVRLGIPSPLTGMTRSFVAMAGGHVSLAARMHPLGPPLFVASALAPAVAIANVIRGSRSLRLARALRARSAWVLIAAALAVVWAVRIAAVA